MPSTSTSTSTQRRSERARPLTCAKPQLARRGRRTAPTGCTTVKFDRYRMHARLEARRVQILTRRGNIWTDKYPAIARDIARLPAKNAYM